MKSFNSVTLVGRVIKETELKEVQNDNKRASFTLAVDRSYKNSEGKHPADFFNVVAWGKLAEICNDYVKKGCLVLINGKIQSRSYEEGKETRWITEIVADSINILEYANNKKEEKEKVLEKAA